MDKEKVIQELQERTEEIKEKAGELHKAIEETISQKKQMHYTELGGQDGQPDVPVKEGYGLVRSVAVVAVAPMRSECGRLLRSTEM